jgi:soluble lytic murein transglycosylase-like protein
MGLAEFICTAMTVLPLPRADYACKHMDTLVAEAQENHIDPVVLAALIHEESRWKPWAVSPAGACGLTQVMPKYTKGRWTCRSLKNPKVSLKAGATILSYWVHTYGNSDYTIGLCGYNGGYRCRGKNKSRRSMAYAKRILRMAAELEELVTDQQKAQFLETQIMSE